MTRWSKVKLKVSDSADRHSCILFSVPYPHASGGNPEKTAWMPAPAKGMRGQALRALRSESETSDFQTCLLSIRVPAELMHSSLCPPGAADFLLDGGCFKERQKFTVTFLLQVLYRDKTEGRRIHAIALSGGWRPVVKNVAEMAVAFPAPHLGPFQE